MVNPVALAPAAKIRVTYVVARSAGKAGQSLCIEYEWQRSLTNASFGH